MLGTSAMSPSSTRAVGTSTSGDARARAARRRDSWRGQSRVDPESRARRPVQVVEALRGLYEAARRHDPTNVVVTYCQGGYRAAHSYLALRILGYPDVRNYTGSWKEWGDREDLPDRVPEAVDMLRRHVSGDLLDSLVFPPPARPPVCMVGQHIGKYRVTEQIGRGGMGTVYRAMDETLHREVAIKVLNADLNDPDGRPAIPRRSGHRCAAESPWHRHDLRILQHEGQWLMVMEFLRGETLDALVVASAGCP